MKASKEKKIKLHNRLYEDIGHHIEGTSFESVAGFVQHVMADIVSTGELSLGGDIPKSEADLVRRRLEVLGYLEAKAKGPLVPVHGGLKEPTNRQVPKEHMDEFIREARALDAYHISKQDLAVLYRFGDGVLSPLEGPMNGADYNRVLEERVLVRGGEKYSWTIPPVFRIGAEQAKRLKSGDRLAIIDDRNEIVGIITVEDLYLWDADKYLESIYETGRRDHPGARQELADSREWLLGGKVEVIPEKPNPLLSDLIMPPRKTREFCANRRWEKVVALHCDTAVLRSQEYGLVLAAEELTREGSLTGIVLNPLVGSNESGLVPAETLVKSLRTLQEKRLLGKGDKDVELWKSVGYDINDQCILLALDMKRFFAGPREAVMHAVYRQNLGFSHIVIEPGHAGAFFDDGTPLFDDFSARDMFEMAEGGLEIEPVCVGRTGYFNELGRMGPAEEHEDKGWQSVSMTAAELGSAVESGETPDPRLMRPELGRILKADHELYKSSVATNVTWHHSSVTKEDREALNDHRGICMWYTGLSASGKSSVAQAVEGKLYERGIRTYVLDGDNVRHGLNANLGFSPDDREENIRRIGHVAGLFAEAGVVVMTAFISPYRNDRDKVRDLMEPGDFIEVFVDCPIEVCEKRDPKGLYKKARAGQIPEFTGISAPYEAPEKPELHIDAGKLSIDECADEVVKYLEENNLISRR